MHDQPTNTLTTTPSAGAAARNWLPVVAWIAGTLVAIVGAGYLGAWLGGVMSERGLDAITMKTNAALGLLLLGVGLVLLVPCETGRVRRWAGWTCAAAAMAIGALTLSENLTELGPGHRPAAGAGTARGGRGVLS